MNTIHLSPDTPGSAVEDVANEIRQLLDAGKPVTITLASEDEAVSPRVAAGMLGFSRQHVVRLVEAGELDAARMAGSQYWRIPVASIVALEDRRRAGREGADRASRELDELGAPAE